MSDTVDIMAEEFKIAYPLTYDAIYNKGRADATKELPTSLYCDGFNDGYPKGKSDAIDELSKEIEYCLNCGMGKGKSLEHLLKVAEKMKEQKNVK